MQNIWLASDHHFYHSNIIGFANRPFADVTEMNEVLIENHNSVVKAQDTVWFLGDVTMMRGGQQVQGKFLKLIRKLKGHKRLIMGNHDHFLPRVYLEAGFEKIVGTGQWFNRLLLSHYPVHPHCVGTALANVHGHIHQHEPSAPATFADGRVVPYINVCVERIDYTPIAVEGVLAMARSARLRYANEQLDIDDQQE